MDDPLSPMYEVRKWQESQGGKDGAPDNHVVYPSAMGWSGLADHHGMIVLSNEEAFAQASLISEDDACASEFEYDEVSLPHCDSSREFEAHGSGEINERKPHLEWWELERDTTLHNDKQTNNPATQDNERWVEAKEDAFSIPVPTTPSSASSSLPSPLQPQPNPTAHDARTRNTAEDQAFEITLQQNLLGQGTRFENFLDRCTWRVEDMLAEGKHTLHEQPLARDVEMYVDAPLAGEGEGTGVGEDKCGEAEGADVQAMLMRDIFALLPPLGASLKGQVMRKESAKRRIESEDVMKVKRVGGSAIPTPSRSLRKREEMGRAQAQSRIPIGFSWSIRGTSIRA